MLVIISYFTFPRLRQHPSPLIFHRCCWDAVFALSHILAYPLGETGCEVRSFINQASMFGSNGYYCCMSVDLFRAIRNPFFAPRPVFYHIYVWTTALLTATIIVATDNWGWSMMDFCWIRTRGDRELNYVIWLLFYIPVLIYYLFSLGVLAFAFASFRKGLPER